MAYKILKCNMYRPLPDILFQLAALNHNRTVRAQKPLSDATFMLYKNFMAFSIFNFERIGKTSTIVKIANG